METAAETGLPLAFLGDPRSASVLALWKKHRRRRRIHSAQNNEFLQERAVSRHALEENVRALRKGTVVG
jgi:hypothetical protein